MKFAIVLSCLALLVAMTTAAPPRPFSNMAEQGFVLPMMMTDYESMAEAESPRHPHSLKNADRGCISEYMCKDTVCVPVKECLVSESLDIIRYYIILCALLTITTSGLQSRQRCPRVPFGGAACPQRPIILTCTILSTVNRAVTV